MRRRLDTRFLITSIAIALQLGTSVPAAAERLLVQTIIDDRDLSITSDALSITLNAGLRSIAVDGTDVTAAGHLMITCRQGGDQVVALIIPGLDTTWGLSKELSGEATIEAIGSLQSRFSAIGLPLVAKPLGGAALIMRTDDHASGLALAIYDDATILVTINAPTARKLLVMLIQPFQRRDLMDKTAQLSQMCRLLGTQP